MRSQLLCLVTALCVLQGCTREEYAALPEVVDFNYHIRPVLSNACYVCHGPDASTREAGLRLDDRVHATARLEHGGRAIVPGSPRRSLVYQRITEEDPERRMPHVSSHKILMPREVALIERWIAQGAEYKTHWAFLPPEAPAEDGVTIDGLLESEMRRVGLAPAPEASRHTLIRRASYVLTGLPPAPALTAAFLADEAPDTYERLVDTLLASAHFGERWARHWMDLVRYAETKGHEFDFAIQGAWQYRDYLIRAFNSDVPYGQFLTEHLAGDLLAQPRRHAEHGFNESAIGTAFYAFGEGKHSPVDTRIDEAERIDNIIDVTTKTFQALTVACARCHDHKFDPIPTADYYALYGIVESSRFAPAPLVTHAYQSRLDSLRAASEALRQRVADQWRRAAGRVPVVAAAVEHSDPSRSRAVLGDFRHGTVDGWFAEGPAFEDRHVTGSLVLDGDLVDHLRHGVLSSRRPVPGIYGAVRSPTFTIANDSIVVQAAGNKAVVRIILDNFQLVRAPIHGGLDQELTTGALSPYIFDVAMWKGTKAYVEILTGTYDKKQYITDQHLLRLQEDSWFEVAYAAAFDSLRPALVPLRGELDASLAAAVEAWAENRASSLQLLAINEALEQGRLPRAAPGAGQLVAQRLAAPAFFTGMTDGDTVTSGVFVRGSVRMEAEEPVPHRFFTVLDADGTPFTASASGRLDLAQAMTHPANPLTARVMVNRLWHHTFGRGIVETVDNFGAQGALPSHPSLLDFLAIRFTEEGGSVKRLLREILLSQAFRRVTTPPDGAGETDPLNRLLTHYPVRRLEAEAIRDGVLAVSGTLDPTLYGPSVPIHLTEFMKGRGRPQASGPLDGDGRRSLYIAVRRNFLSPMMLAFDAPLPFSTFGKRNASNVPAQSLTLLNDPFVAQQARVWAEALVDTPHASAEARIGDMFLRAFARAATEEEIHAGMEYLGTTTSQAAVPLMADVERWTAYCHVIFNMKEFIYLI